MKFGGGGATRKTGSCCDLDLCHSSAKDNLSPKPLKKTGLESFYEKMICHSGPDPESINADKNRLRLRGRSDQSSRMLCTPSRHSDESQSLSMPVILIRHLWRQKCRKAAFTMAEVLITLGIIGIVAAMTLPTLIVNHRKQVALTKIKHTYNILSNALERAKVDYDTEVNSWYIPTEGTNLEKSMFFVETYMLPYLQVLHYCKDKYVAPYCNIKVKGLTTIGSSQGTILGPADSSYGTAFVLNSGAVVYVQVGHMTQSEIDMGGISRIRIKFDIDGPKGFNKMGYDVFEVELGGADGPNKKNNADRNKFLPYNYDTSKNCDYYVSEMPNSCNLKAAWGSGSMCLAYIVCKGWDFGDKYPW